ncbi:MAG: branched-chain amino acid transporter AzlC [Ruminococcaceae bacterium]|nr:branched-chain amino acid transporter AzlC [Oscillospiraceae bacterium]
MKNEIKRALRDTIPVLSGYMVLGMGFGIVMHSNGFGVWWTLAMSALIYAGSMQYLAVDLLAGGASLISAAIATLMVNARHIFYGISMVDRYKGTGARKPYLIFALTDETYSLVCSGEKSKRYYLFVSVFDHIYWICGSVIGSLLGQIIPFSTEGIDFALTALFVTVFVEQWKNTKDHIPAMVGVCASVLCLVLFGKDDFLIPAMVLITAALSVLKVVRGEAEEK